MQSALAKDPALQADRPAGQPAASPQARLLRGYLHKTSNSLCGIKGYASLIAGLGARAADNARWAQKIILEIENMERVFRSVGDLAALSNPPAEPAALADVVAEAAETAAADLPNLRVRCGEIPGGQPLLPAADLRMILMEILKNCAEGAADEPVPTVATITCRRTGEGRFQLRVQDDGAGIPAELLPQVREPFLSTKTGHLGIGLARVDAVMDMYGLAWSVASGPEGGTTVALEAAAAAAAAGEQS